MTLSATPGLMVVYVTLDTNGIFVRNVKALIDSGSSTSFISSSLVDKENLPSLCVLPLFSVLLTNPFMRQTKCHVYLWK